MTDVLRILIVLVPLIGFGVTWRVMHELRRDDRVGLARPAVVRLRRTPEGGFEETEAAD
jgi:hypothetical protein